MKQIPQRMCVVCRKMQNKNDLIRIVKNADDKIFVDTTFKANGRGAYVCKNELCVSKLEKSKALLRAFKMAVPAQTFEQIKLFINPKNL